MPDLWIPDVSEFQSVDFSVFSGPIIVRAHNSNRADNHWPQHAAGASQQPWWGAYQYLTKGANPTAAARAFIATLGGYSPNVVILDLEEGDGDQNARQHEWLAAVTGHEAWTYSGLYFARTHNLDNVQWLAAYQSREPSDAHLLWQAADAHDFPGIGTCDGSLFHGTVADLLALTGSGGLHMDGDVQAAFEDLVNRIADVANREVDIANRVVDVRKNLPTAVGGGASEDAIRAIVRDELSKLKLAQS